MRIAELADRRVAIWGFGREGHAVIRALRTRLPAQSLTLFCSTAEVDAARAFDAALEIIAGEPDASTLGQDRKSVVSGKRVSVRVDLGGRRIIKKKQSYIRHVDHSRLRSADECHRYTQTIKQ